MSFLVRLRRSPWLSGTVLLVLAVFVAAPFVHLAGRYGWPAFAGAAALLLLAFGSLERLWQKRSLPRHHRPVDRRRFRVVNGGKTHDKSNGHARDVGGGEDDKPRWVM